MQEQFKWYAFNLYQGVPTEVYEGLLSISCIGIVGFLLIFGWKRGWRKVVGLLLSEYVFLIYCSTVIFRGVSEENGYNYKLFWSYVAIHDGRCDLIPVNIMNVVVFVPVGLLLALLTLNRQKTIKSGLFTIVFGLLISTSIETLQFFLNRGFSELDDVMHNTLGCMIGYGIYLLMKTGYKHCIVRVKNENN